jgi:hypothetical protein
MPDVRLSGTACKILALFGRVERRKSGEKPHHSCNITISSAVHAHSSELSLEFKKRKGQLFHKLFHMSRKDFIPKKSLLSISGEEGCGVR